MMKKLYSMMAFALVAAGMSAQAKAPVSGGILSSDATEIFSVADMTVANKAVDANLNAPAKISGASDLYGSYVVSSMQWGLGGSPMTCAPYIYAGDTPNQVLINGLPFVDVEFSASVDAAKSTLTLVEQDAYYNPNYNEMVKLMFLNTETSTMEDEVVANILEDGSIQFPEKIMVSLKLPSYAPGDGYFFGALNMLWKPIKAYKFDASEWTSIGKATFEDAFLNNVLYPEYRVPGYEVEIMKHNTIEGDYILVNPYKNSAWTEVWGHELTDGHLRFNISYPECVYVYPLVKSGALIQQEENGPWLDMYMFNVEGLMITEQGYTPEEVYDEYSANFTPVSYYDEETGLVSITNMYFGIGDREMLSQYWWTGTDPETELWTDIKLDLAGVEGIMVDENAPVKYFNLQGVEVANPEAGQLVIKKQGSKAQKMIVR